jgi:hypothetical protein
MSIPLSTAGDSVLHVSGNSTVQELTVRQAATLYNDLTVAGKSTLNNGASISQGLTVDNIHASANIDTTGNMFSNTTYGTYSNSANSNLVVNKKILDQVVKNLTGSSPATLQSIINLVEAFNTADESVLNAVLHLLTFQAPIFTA